MPRKLIWAMVVVIVAPCICQADASNPDSTRLRQVRMAVDSNNAKWIEAHRLQDGALLASLFAPDGAFLLSGGRILQGPDSIKVVFGAYLKESGPFAMTITTRSFWLIDSVAYEYGDYTRKCLKQGADTSTFSGRYFEIWKEQPNGSWKVLRDCGLPK